MIGFYLNEIQIWKLRTSRFNYHRRDLQVANIFSQRFLASYNKFRCSSILQ